MGNVPGPPNLANGAVRPDAKDTTLEFWWDEPPIQIPPVEVSSYTLSCSSIPFSQTVNSSTFYLKVSSLTNSTDYTFQILATNEFGDGNPISFRTVQPGLVPNSIASPTATVISSSAVQIGWTGPIPDSSIPSTGWFVVQSISSSPSDPEIRVSAYSTDNTATISSLNISSLYVFNVYAINDPGYSLPISTTPISPILFVGDVFTYIELYQPDGGSNYTYRIYNTQADSWIETGSPYSVSDYDDDYTSSNFSNYYQVFGGTSNTFCITYASRYANPSTGYDEYKFEFRQTNGLLLRTVSTSINNTSWDLPYAYGDSNTGFFYNSNDVTSNYDIQIYQPNTNTYKLSSITNTNNSMNNVQLLNNGVYFVTSNIDHYKHYIWNINSNTPTLITSNYDYDYTYTNFSTAIFVIGRQNNPSYFDTVTYMDDSGFSSNYSLASNTYTNINISQYGINGNHPFFDGYNSNTSNYDIYVFNQLPSMTPIILSNLQSNRYILDKRYDFGNTVNFYETTASDSLLILSLQGTSASINAGGGMPYYDNENLFNYGNSIDIRITLEDSSVPVNQNEIYYGTFSQRSNYGYLVGSVDAYPHTSFTYTSAGSNQIYVYGSYTTLQVNPELYSTFTGAYTCANGNEGTYWVRQTGSTVPSSSPLPFGVDLWYTVTNSNWNSAILTSVQDFTNSGATYNYSNIVYGSNFILCKSLIGSISSIGGLWEGAFLDETTIVNFLQSYVNDAPFCDDPNNFSTINVQAFDDWNVSTGYVYYSTLLTTNFPYIYDGSLLNPRFGKGTGYLLTGSNTSVVSSVFTSSNLLVYQWTTLNSNGAGFIEQEQNVVKAHILTESGETSTILSSINAIIPGYETNSDSDNFKDLFYYNIRSAINSNTDAFFYILSNDGSLLTSTNSVLFPNTQFSGRNALIYENNTSNLTIIQNGLLTSTIYLPYGEDTMLEPYPDFANGQLAITSYDNDSNTIVVTVTNDAISTFSTNFFTDNTNLVLTQSFLMMWQSYPFQLLAYDMNTGTEYGFSTIGNLYQYDDYYNQTDSIGFKVIDDNSSAISYVVFNFSTTIFNMLDTLVGDNEKYTFTTSPYWYYYD